MTLTKKTMLLTFVLGAAACSREEPAVARAGLDGLREAATHAEDRLGVPADLSLAVAWTETRFEGVPSAHHHDDGAHVPSAIGVGGLRPWLAGDPAAVAERTLGATTEEIDADPVLGILASAAVLRELALSESGELPPAGEPAAWAEALAGYAGLRGEEAGADYAERVLRILRYGLQATTARGEEITIRSRDLPPLPGIAGRREYHHPEYAGARWIPAREGHFHYGRDGHEITHIIIHTMQGTYESAISWFRDPSNPSRTSAHYNIRSSDGAMTQMVHEEDAARHIGSWNWFTIGIEHEGWMEDPDRWYTDTMYRASAGLTRHLCDKYGIPIDREHILGHGDVPGAATQDPGSGWDWDYYMRLVREAGGPELPDFDASFVGIAEAPTELVSGEEGVIRIDFQNDGSRTWTLETTRLGTSAPEDRESPFYADYNWIDARRPTPPDAAYASGEVGRFSFAVVAPEVSVETDMVETYRLVEEGVGYFGPEVEVPIRVVPRDGPDLPETDAGAVEPDEDAGPGGDAGVEDPVEPDPAGGCSASGRATGPWGALALISLGAAWLRRRRG